MKQSYWREEPARLSGQIAALLALLAASGLQISDQTTAAITSLGSGVAVLLGAYFLRTKVTSPATVDRLKAAKAAVTVNDTKTGVLLEVPTVYVEDLPRLDPRLGRSVRHDDRSRAWAVPELPKSEIRPVHWTRRSPVLDQGQLGSCTGNAAAGWLATDNVIRPGSTGITEKTALGIYSDATKIDPFKGTWPPKDTGSNGLSVAKVLKNRHLCASYSHAFTPQAAYSALQNGPVMVGTVWLESMFTPNGDGRIVVDRHSKVAGGHEYLIDQLETDGHGNVTKVWMCNSWSTSWAISGRAYFTKADFEWLLGQKGDCTAPLSVPVKAAKRDVCGRFCK